MKTICPLGYQRNGFVATTDFWRLDSLIGPYKYWW